MRRIYLIKRGSSEKALETREEPDPIPGKNEITIRVEASGLNFADVLARLGLYPDAPPIPCVLGYEVVGIVERIGEGAAGFEPGDRVLAFTRFGGYASHVAADCGAAIKIPDSLNAGEAAALATQYCTAWYAAEEMVQLHPGDKVLVQAAAGGVGTALVQMAKRRKCVVFGTAGSPEKIEFLKDQGVDHPINYRAADFEKVIRGICGKGGLDVVFDSIGGKTFKKGWRLLGSGGRMISLGVAQMAGKRRSPWRSLKTLFGFGMVHPIPLLMKSKGVIGVNMLRIADDKPEVLRRCMRAVLELALKKELKPHAGAEFPAHRVAQAHDYLAMRESVGKVVLKWE